MDAPGLGIQSVVGVVAVVLVTIFLKLFRDLITKIIPDGFALLREEMKVANKAAEARHKEHIQHMEGIQSTLDRQDGVRRRGIAARAKRKAKAPGRPAGKPKKLL